jgi:hypothetical protein
LGLDEFPPLGLPLQRLVVVVIPPFAIPAHDRHTSEPGEAGQHRPAGWRTYLAGCEAFPTRLYKSVHVHNIGKLCPYFRHNLKKSGRGWPAI